MRGWDRGGHPAGRGIGRGGAAGGRGLCIPGGQLPRPDARHAQGPAWQDRARSRRASTAGREHGRWLRDPRQAVGPRRRLHRDAGRRGRPGGQARRGLPEGGRPRGMAQGNKWARRSPGSSAHQVRRLLRARRHDGRRQRRRASGEPAIARGAGAASDVGGTASITCWSTSDTEVGGTGHDDYQAFRDSFALLRDPPRSTRPRDRRCRPARPPPADGRPRRGRSGPKGVDGLHGASLRAPTPRGPAEAEIRVELRTRPRPSTVSGPARLQREPFPRHRPPGGVLGRGCASAYVNSFGGSKVGAVRPIYQVGTKYVEGEENGQSPRPT